MYVCGVLRTGTVAVVKIFISVQQFLALIARNIVGAIIMYHPKNHFCHIM